MFDRAEDGITAEFPCDNDSQESGYLCLLRPGLMSVRYLCDQTNDYHNLCKEHDRHMGSAKMV